MINHCNCLNYDGLEQAKVNKAARKMLYKIVSDVFLLLPGLPSV